MSWSIFNQSFYQSAYIQSLSCPPRYGLTPTSIWTLTCFKDKAKIEAPHQVHARAPSAKCEFHVDHQHPQVNWSIDPWLIGTPTLFMILFQTAIYYVTTAFVWGVVGSMQVILYSPLWPWIGQFPQPYFSQLPCVITILTPHFSAYESRSICNQVLYT